MSNFSPYELGVDLLSPNRNLAPITSQIDDKGSLFVGGCLLSDLARHYGTPLYVIDEKTIRESCKAYVNALNNYYSGRSLPLYASKANSSIALSRIVFSEGFGIDVVSEGELLTALNAGIPGEKIFLHGNNKSVSELVLAYKNKVTIVIDNQQDIDLLNQIVQVGEDPAVLMLRFTPGIECHTHEYIRTGHLDSKFGFDYDQIEQVLKQLKEAQWCCLKGLHAHIGSQIFELEPHRDLSVVMIDILSMAKSIGHQIENLNVGGGLGIRYVSSDDPPSINQWIKEISRKIMSECDLRNLELPRLLCEPGRSIVATSGLTLYTIGSRKVIPGIGRTYLSVDGGMSDNPRPITYQSLYTCCLADYSKSSSAEKITIAGKHCESGDVVLKDISLPLSQRGDVLVVFATGAYNASMSSNYNRIPRPATVIVNNGTSDLILKREKSEDLLRNDLLPDRLRR